MSFFHSLLSAGGSSLPLVLSDEVVSFIGEEITAAGGVGSTQYAPKLLYQDGQTHYVYHNGVTGRLNILTYDDRYGVGRKVGFRNRTGNFDTHHNPAVFYDNGHLYVVVEKNHNADPMSILKNRTQGDPFIFSLSATVISPTGANPTYPKIYKKNGIFISLGQISDVNSGFNKNTSGDFEGAWADAVQIATRQADEDEHYPHYILNSDMITDEVVFTIGARNDDPVPAVYFRKYLIRAAFTAGGVTYYNWDRSFSKTTQISSAELNTNFKYYDTGSDLNQAHGPRAAVDDNGNFYDLTDDGVGGYDFIYLPIGAPSPTIKEVVLPGAPTIDSRLLILPISSTEVYVIFAIQSGGFSKPFLYKTTDLGDTYTLIGDMLPTINDDITDASLPANYGLISSNKNFGFFFYTAADPTHSSIYVKKAAFGNIQPETGDPFDVVPYTESEYNALMERSYYVEAGKVTNVGTGATGLIDQSPEAQNATVVGSPTLDDAVNPTKANLDGVNDAFSVPITGLTSLSEGLIICVTKEVAVGPQFLAASRTTVTTEYLTVGTSTDSTVVNDSGASLILGKSSITDDYHIFAFVFQNGVCDVLQFLDGELQLRNPSLSAITEGRFLNAHSGGFNSVQIGRRVRSNGTTWYGFDLKHLAISGVPPTYENLCKMMKYLANKYNITLNSHFR